MSATADGASLVGETVTATDPVAVAVPSLTVYVKLTDVVSLPSCVYVTLLLSSDNATLPFTAPPTAVMLRVSPSGSESFESSVVTATSTSPPSETVKVSATADGASLTGVTVTETVAVAVAVPSLTVYVKLPGVVSLPSCVYVTLLLSSASVTLPFTAPPTAVMLRLSPSASVSLASSVAAVISTSPPSATVAVSLTPVGASLTGVTVTETVPVAISVPSLTVYVKLPDVVSLPSCVYVTSLMSSETVTLPLTAPPTPVKLRLSPSGSESFESSDSTEISTLPPSATVAVSPPADGPSFAGETVTATDPVAVAMPSLTVYVKLPVVVSLPSCVYVTLLLSSASVTLPFTAPPTAVMLRLSPSASVSFASSVVTATSTSPPSATVAVSLTPVGALLTGVTVTETVPVAVSVPSLTVYVKLPDVVSLPSCVYVTLLLSSDNATLPFTAPPTAVMLRVSPSASVSFASSVVAATSTSPPSATVKVSATADGASFTGVTVTETVPEPVAVPSLTVYVKLPVVVSLPSCVYLTLLLSSASVTLPFTAPPTAVMLRVSPSGSVSLASRVVAVTSTLPPSATEAESSTGAGASLTSATVRVNVADDDFDGLPSSVAVTFTVCVAGVSASSGVPLNVRLVALKLSQPGNALPSSSAAAYVTVSLSGSSNSGAT